MYTLFIIINFLYYFGNRNIRNDFNKIKACIYYICILSRIYKKSKFLVLKENRGQLK